MRFYKFAQSALASFLFAVTFTASAHAQNNKQIVAGTYYEDRARNLTAATSSTLTLAQTPTDRYVNITNVSCLVITNATQVFPYAQLQVGTAPGSSDLGRTYTLRAISPTETANGYNFYSVGVDGMFFKIGPGRFPSIIIFSSSPSSGGLYLYGDCTVTGTVTDS